MKRADPVINAHPKLGHEQDTAQHVGEIVRFAPFDSRQYRRVRPAESGRMVTYRINRQIYDSLVAENLSKPSSEVPVPPIIPQLAT